MRSLVVIAVAGCSGGARPVRSDIAPAPPADAALADATSGDRSSTRDVATGTGDRIAAVPASAPDAAAIDKGIIRRVVRESLPKIVACYEVAPAAQRDPRASFGFVIGSDGRVIRATVGGVSRELAGCLEGVLGAMVFPPPSGGGTVEVSYPFWFDSSGS